jgi:hypothetical protein
MIQHEARQLLAVCERTLDSSHVNCAQIRADASMNLGAHAVINALGEHFHNGSFFMCAQGGVCSYILFRSVQFLVENTVIILFIVCGSAVAIFYMVYTVHKQKMLLEMLRRQPEATELVSFGPVGRYQITEFSQ